MEVYKREDILFKFQIADEAQYIKIVILKMQNL